MLQKPNLPDDQINTCLRQVFGLRVTDLAFLPLGADLHSAVYRATDESGSTYLVKLRRGPFLQASVTVPRYLHEQGLAQIIPPLPALTGRLWADIGQHSVILYPFVTGLDGYETDITDAQRVALGAALRVLHTTTFPPAIIAGVPEASFSPRRREAVTSFLTRIATGANGDDAAQALAALLLARQGEILDLVGRAARLAAALQAQTPPFVLCHADVHGWNLLVADDGAFYIVDWDELIFAPKERDLMFVGGGLGGRGHTVEEEERLFYRGYGPTRIDAAALAYYRFERIVEDIAAYCEEIFLSEGGEADRRQAVANVHSNFRPGGTIAMAYRAAAQTDGSVTDD